MDTVRADSHLEPTIQGHRADADIKWIWSLNMHDTLSWLQSLDISAKWSVSCKDTDVTTQGHGQVHGHRWTSKLTN